VSYRQARRSWSRRGHPASTTISEEDARRERREWNRGAVRRGGGTDTGDGGTVCEQRRE
jgi:hypothetical protein